MSISQQKKQLELYFGEEYESALDRSSEMFIASRLIESPTGHVQLMEKICERKNMRRALKRVRKNKGKPGVDGMTVDQLPGYLRRHWGKIRAQLLCGTYKPLPVRRVERDKPEGGVRLLGIPAVVDRLIQQATLQVLQEIWDETFSEYSYGFRPERSQYDAIWQAKRYIEAGYRHVVDIDLEKFFDRVNHDRLMSRLATKVEDKRVLKLVRSYLMAGVLIGGLVSPTEEGVPQGGPLSPMLSNIVLDELDKELEKRGLHFVRFADDCVIYVGSKRAGERVMRSVSRFITRRLKLQVNEAKSAVSHPWWRKYLGFSFTSTRGDTRIRIHSKSIKRFKERVRQLTPRSGGRSIQQVIDRLNPFLRGWWNYYRLAETHTFIRPLNYWVMRRLRAIRWKQWKNPRTRVRELKKRGVYHNLAVTTGNSRKGPWRVSRCKAVVIALPNAYFKSLGLVLLRK